MDDADRASAESMRARLVAATQISPASFHAALVAVSPQDRDAWLDLALGLDDLPDDEPALPRGCVPYLPCSVQAVLQLVEQVHVGASDVFVDIGSGVGRAMALVHLLTGADVIGLEIQPGLVTRSIELFRRLRLDRASIISGDAAHQIGAAAHGSIFLLYCPFGNDRLDAVLAALEAVGRTRQLHVCCIDLPLPSCSWLTLVAQPSEGISIYQTLIP